MRAGDERGLRGAPGGLLLDSVDALSVLEPFGMANPQPLFCLRDMRVVCVSPIGNDRHTRLILASGPMRFDAVHFGACAGKHRTSKAARSISCSARTSICSAAGACS